MRISIPLLLLIPISCTWHDPYYPVLLQSDYETEGFLSSDTFQIAADGEYTNETATLEQRRREALLDARAKALEKAATKIIESKLHDIQAKNPNRLIEIDKVRVLSTRKRIKSILRNGHIIYRKYYPDGSCRIVFRIHKDGLRSEIGKLEIPLLR